MPEKIKIIFRNILNGARTLTVMPDNERRHPIDGGGFRRDYANLHKDLCNVASDMRRATRQINGRQTT